MTLRNTLINNYIYVFIRKFIPFASLSLLPRKILYYIKGIILQIRLFLLNIGRKDYAVLYLGDSHAYAFCLPNVPKIDALESVKRVGYREYLCWIGPKLMFSIGNSGIPAKAKKEIEELSKNHSTLIIVWFFGEIDIRVFGKKYYYENTENIHHTVKRYMAFIKDNFQNFIHVITIPTAPSDIGQDNPQYPRNGVLEERIAVLKRFEKEILLFNNEFQIFDPNQLNNESYLSRKESIDGCHFDFLHALKLRNILHKLIKQTVLCASQSL